MIVNGRRMDFIPHMAVHLAGLPNIYYESRYFEINLIREFTLLGLGGSHEIFGTSAERINCLTVVFAFHSLHFGPQ